MSGRTGKPGMSPEEKSALLASLRGSAAPPRRKPAAPARPGGDYAHLTDFTSLPNYQRLQMQHDVSEMLQVANPFFQAHDGCPADTSSMDGVELINFASYNYLGLNGHPEVVEAAAKAMALYGTSASASRVVGGDRPIHHELEAELADFYGAEDALVFVSGYSTNVATICELMGPKDLILHDALMHNSAIMGAEYSGAARRAFAHNDPDALEDILLQCRGDYQRVLILIEGLYSMDGDIPDLARFTQIKQRHDAWLMVDEAHGLGVLGRTGRGLAEHCGLDPTLVDIWMGTMSKTLAGCGGFIAGQGALIDLLKYNASGFVYSVGLAPPLAAASLAALRILLREPERVARLQENGALFRKLANEAGLDTGSSAGMAVVPVIVGDSMRAVKLVERLRMRGFCALPILYPAVPEKTARLRFFISSTHSPEQLAAAVAATAEELKALEEAGFGVSSALSAMS